METYKLRIDEIRKLREMSVADLAQAVGVSRAAMYKLCSGENWPAAERLTKISEALRVKPWELFDGAPLTSIKPRQASELPDLVAA